MAEETSPRDKKASTKQVAEAQEEITPFDPIAALNEDQLVLKDQLRVLAEEYSQDDRERAWLST